ncbi:uncharacterized protein PAC_06615 [Phialocephala subalpina]|uniref:Uncharacterized protein n=1 Tax=Phialocephala subalpina TaxID=576137 RepID=A0A1L7WVC4_9HELO|nr:uncharacterized protein PAC_06615 [Phialocephala subalpina]
MMRVRLSVGVWELLECHTEKDVQIPRGLPLHAKIHIAKASVKDDYQFLMNCNGRTYTAGETLLFCCSGTNSRRNCCSLNFSLPYTAANGLTGHAFIPGSEDAAVTTTLTARSTSTGSSTASPTSSSIGAASQSANSSTTASISSSTGISTGAIAGASVGCAIGGLLLGAALSFLMLRLQISELAINDGTYYEPPKNAYPGPSAGSPMSPEQNYTPAMNQYTTQTVQQTSSAIPNYELDGNQHREVEDSSWTMEPDLSCN